MNFMNQIMEPRASVFLISMIFMVGVLAFGWFLLSFKENGPSELEFHKSEHLLYKDLFLTLKNKSEVKMTPKDKREMFRKTRTSRKNTSNSL